MEGSAGVMALVLGQTVAGSAAMLWSVPLWHEVRRGYFTLSGAVLTVLAFAWWRSADAGLVGGSVAGRWSVRLALASGALSLAGTVLLLAKRQEAARALGLVVVSVSAAGLGAMAGTARQSEPVAL